MLYLMAATAVLLLHLGFIVFVLFGGLLVARWRWMLAVHLPAVAWGVFIELSGRDCPLTSVENFFRMRAGQSGYTESFIEHYLLTLIYPAGLSSGIQWLLALVVIVLNLAIYGWLFYRHRHSARTHAGRNDAQTRR